MMWGGAIWPFWPEPAREHTADDTHRRVSIWHVTQLTEALGDIATDVLANGEVDLDACIDELISRAVRWRQERASQ